jgi:CheY-like chemotaxis protein
MSVHRVLIIDDDWKSADPLAALLESFEYVTRAAYSGVEGIEVARVFRPDAVVLDIGMPGMDGYAVGGVLRRELPDARLIAVSGFGRDCDRERASRIVFFAYLVKPLDLGALACALDAPEAMRELH